MKIEKSFVINAPRQEVWEYVASPEEVGMCFPGCESVKNLGDDKYEAAIRVQLGPIKTVFNVNFTVTEKREGEFLAYTSRGEEANRASRLKADSTLSLSPLNDHSTELVYTSDLSIVGRLGKFGLGMMKNKADTMGDEFVEELRMAIEGPGEIEAPVPATPGLWPRRVTAAITAAIIIYIIYMLLR
jgi:carbon monoxide dehydrogenase subunit G